MPTFKTTLHGVEGRSVTGIVIPPEVVESLNAGRRPKVVIRIGDLGFRSTVAVMGGRYMVGVTAEHRAQSGLKAGDPIEVSIELDVAPREVNVPADLQAAIEGAGLRDAWDRLAYSHRKEHVRTIEEAKSPETRQRRIEKAVGMVVGAKPR